MKDLSSESFSQWFDMKCCKPRTLKSLLQDGSLISRIRSEAPEVVFIHLGQGDLWDKREGDIIVDYFKQIVWKILKDTNTKVCLSLIIPVNGFPQMNSVIMQVNTFVANFMTDVRRDQKYRYRVFTSNNNSLSGYIISTLGQEGPQLKLNNRCQKLICLRLNLVPPRGRQPNDNIYRNLPRNNTKYEY